MHHLIKLSITALAAALLLTSCGKPAATTASDNTEARIDSVLSLMTLDEKIGQLNQLTGLGLNDDIMAEIRAGHVGSILNELDPMTINKLQRIAVEETRLGIPMIFARDVIHGFKTIFPIPLGQAATWNDTLVEEGARWAAFEASSAGIRWTFAPMIDVSRDGRWGRIAESCGEDPLLNARMGVAMVRGFQGDDLTDPHSIAACAKHFAGYGLSESGKDYNTTWIPEVMLRDTYLPPFKAVADAGCATFMCSFNDINGVPSSGNAHLNIDILRREWRYDGLLVSDWGSTEQMIPHGFVADLKEAAMASANAGMDMDMMSYAYIRHLPTLVAEGAVKESTVDAAVRNVLRLKFRLGLFDRPYVDEPDTMPFYTEDALASAQRAAEESTILLKNNGILPLKNIKSVAVVGPLADAPADQVGTWCFDAEPDHCITPMMAIKQMYAAKGIDVIAEEGLTYSRDYSKAGIDRAVSAARQADVILFFCGEESILSGEARCRADISLPGAQREMMRSLKATGRPVVMIVMAGRPMTIADEVAQADAVLYQFHAGTMAGPALARVIDGTMVPSGKLPVTLPRMVGQTPIYYSHKNTGRPASNITMIDDIEVGTLQTSLGYTSYHLEAGDGPLFPFGFGLSYTQFEYSPVSLSAQTIGLNDSITARCTVTNTGSVDAYETVQLYTRDLVASLCQPVRILRDYRKLLIPAGRSVDVEFTIAASDLGFHHLDNSFYTEPGDFQLWISTDAATGTPATFSVK